MESVKYLIENCFYSIKDVNTKGKSVLSYCLEFYNQEIYNYLFSKQTNINFPLITEKPTDYEPDVFQACKEGKVTSVQWLIEKENINKNNTDYKDDPPIHVASEYGHLPIVQYLIEKQKVDKDIKGNEGKTALHFASEKGHLPIVEYLIYKGANLESKDGFQRSLCMFRRPSTSC